MAANPNPSRITDAMWNLWEALAVLAPGSHLGGIYANKAGYHNTRAQNDPWDYSVCDDPPDQWGPADKAAAIDWTFPEAQYGDYSRISVYTQRLLYSAQDPDDNRLNGWREFYGNSDDDSFVEGWDIRYACPATSDSSHLWHIHLSENRNQTTSQANKDAVLSVLKGETVEEWGGDMSAEDVWTYDIDPSDNRYSAGGATWTVYERTDYLANTFAPSVSAQLADLQDTVDQAGITSQRQDLETIEDRLRAVTALLLLLAVLVILLGAGTLYAVLAAQ